MAHRWNAGVGCRNGAPDGYRQRDRLPRFRLKGEVCRRWTMQHTASLAAPTSRSTARRNRRRRFGANTLAKRIIKARNPIPRHRPLRTGRPVASAPASGLRRVHQGPAGGAVRLHERYPAVACPAGTAEGKPLNQHQAGAGIQEGRRSGSANGDGETFCGGVPSAILRDGDAGGGRHRHSAPPRVASFGMPGRCAARGEREEATLDCPNVSTALAAVCVKTLRGVRQWPDVTRSGLRMGRGVRPSPTCG
jgi:hypothetical protein